MYIQSCHSDDVREEVYHTLKILGIKSSLKKLNSKLNLMASSKKIFNTPIYYLDKQPVILHYSGAVVHIPSFVISACNHLRSDLTVEGIFRKAGSGLRQKELKARLENGEGFKADDHVIDVANILKTFLRELPEPLIPYNLHETFLKCLLLKGREQDTILLSSLLIPAEHMDCLTYILEFLNEVSALKDYNKMSASNLATIFAPNIMPLKINSSQVVLNQNNSNHIKIVKVLLDKVCLLGSVPDYILEKLPADLQNNQNNGRRRNSGSLTRMFSGFKKMVNKVSSNTADTNFNSKGSAPVFGTPSNSHHAVPVLSAKKRKVVDGSTPFSMKKRRDVLRCLPEEELLPKSPMVPKCLSSRLTIAESRNNISPERDDILRDCANGSREDLEPYLRNPRYSGEDGHRESTSRSHSALRRLSNFSRRKLKAAKLMAKSSSVPALNPDTQVQNTLVTTPRRLAMSQESCSQFSDEEFIRVPKREYEDVKHRLSELESQISAEFTSIEASGVSLSDSDGSQENLRTLSEADKVQSQYQKTLLEAGRLSDPCADTIAQHLSRELKIRHSTGGRVMRSPSQRKIGTIRRRSQERVPKNLQFNLQKAKTSQLYRSRSLQRGKPNPIQPNFHQVSVNGMKLGRSFSQNSKRRPAITAPLKAPLMRPSGANPQTTVLNPESGEVWRSAESFLATNGSEPKPFLMHCDKRESIKQIRAGMVREKAKMFSNIADRKSALPRNALPSGNFVTCIKLNTVGSNAQSGPSPHLVKKCPLSKILEPPPYPGKENSEKCIKDVRVSPSVYKTPVSSFLHRSQRPAGSPSSSAKRRQNRPVIRSQSDRTPHKTVIAVGNTPRRSPRLNDIKKI